MITKHQLYGVYIEPLSKGRMRWYTKNLVPGKQVYGEKLVKQGKDEFREWDIRRSKLAASLAKGVSQLGIKPGSKVLYLGCASGTTASHVADIIGHENAQGFLFGLDFAPRVLREFVHLCEDRKNMTAILGDAKHPETYAHKVLAVDAVVQDVAQRDQVTIFLKNCERFLKHEGFGLLVVKAGSIAVEKHPREIFRQVKNELEQSGKLSIVDYRELEPFEKDHCIFVCKWK
ncbi:TPA: fibrillarin-like rRNA/tRNA 2'-O-methyltransferase [Candidatus Woesearchaeota archaeon]|nr:fibrillarin-like rRNA/tRNA 2'-O-methyltransferase [Candidatus Woesearchaeota archaeon]HIH46675.1 fibrillarin-like rRNA/tRNA 2'-O-methyltransferase [Candidatus Woesearchaeota archaeon]HII88389.1 fibrillarin-like rRNA/tRNA 2'-O-methyltransferase [Candidatus Woesearchaeota archaeon]